MEPARIEAVDRIVNSSASDGVLARDRLFAPLEREWEAFMARPESYVTEGERIVSLGRYVGTYRKTGRSMVAPFAHVWTVRGGKIVGFVQYTDTAKVLEALHGSP